MIRDSVLGQILRHKGLCSLWQTYNSNGDSNGNGNGDRVGSRDRMINTCTANIVRSS